MFRCCHGAPLLVRISKATPATPVRWRTSFPDSAHMRNEPLSFVGVAARVCDGVRRAFGDAPRLAPVVCSSCAVRSTCFRPVKAVVHHDDSSVVFLPWPRTFWYIKDFKAVTTNHLRPFVKKTQMHMCVSMSVVLC